MELAVRAKALTEYVSAYNDFMDSEGDNKTLVDICNKVSAYNLKRQNNPTAYQWNEVLAVVYADYNDGELSGRVEALKDAADAYLECQQVFSDTSSSEQEMRTAARTLATALKNKYYKRAFNSPLGPVLPKIRNQKQVSVFRSAQ